MLRLKSAGVDQTREIARVIAGLARPRDLIVLSGEMGAGKTAFTQGFAEAMGVREPVTSPTFNLIHTYRGTDLEVHHVDLYRLERTGELDDLGLTDLLDVGGVMLVEWGDVVGDALGDALIVRIELVPTAALDERLLLIHRRGEQWSSRWDTVQRSLQDWFEQ